MKPNEIVISNDPNKKGSTTSRMKISLGYQLMLCRNINANDELLINGAMKIIRSIKWPVLYVWISRR